MRRRQAMRGSAIVALGMLGLAGAARAESGYLPFYGYSDYFGGPGIAYTRETDVQATTRPVDGLLGLGVRTYSAGGPFWHYRPAHPVAHRTARKRYRTVLRSRG